jgi:hypothetical protein
VDETYAAAGRVVAETAIAVSAGGLFAAVVAVMPAFPVVLIARRLASARSRELRLLAACAIV